MADLTEVLPPKNHNNPPSETEWLGENLTLRHVALIRQAEEHVALAIQMPAEFTQDNEAEFTADFVKRMQECQKQLEKNRKAEKEPFLRQGQFVDEFFNTLSGKIASAIVKATMPLQNFLSKKAREEQAQRERDAKDLHEQQTAALKAVVAPEAPQNAIERAEAVEKVINTTASVKIADSLAAAPVTSMASASGKISRAALATKWVGTIKNIEELDIIKLRPYITSAELQKALDKFVRQGGRQCEGCEIKETVEAKVK